MAGTPPQGDPSKPFILSPPMEKHIDYVSMFPIEVWSHIFSFLEPVHIERIMILHPLFLAVARPFSWHKITLGSSHLTRSMRLKELEQHPTLLPSVRTLHIVQWRKYDRWQPEKTKAQTCLDLLFQIRGKVSSLFGRKKDPFRIVHIGDVLARGGCISYDQTIALATSTIQIVSNVDTIEAEFSSRRRLPKEFLGYIRMWSTIGSVGTAWTRLRSLRFKISTFSGDISEASNCLESAKPAFHRLEIFDLILDLRGAQSLDRVDLCMTSIHRLFNCLRHSLQYLAMTVHWSKTQFQDERLLDLIGNFPKLEKFARFTILGAEWTPSLCQKYDEFLSRHRQTLKEIELIWSPSLNNSDTHLPILTTQFHMTSIAISFAPSMNAIHYSHRSRLLPLLRAHSQSLIAISMQGVFYTFEELEVIFDGQTYNGPGARHNRLRQLWPPMEVALRFETISKPHVQTT